MGDGPQSVTACIFWLKTRAQWKETQVQEFSGVSPVLNITWSPPLPEDRSTGGNIIDISPPHDRKGFRGG